MFLDSAREHLADIMTINRSLSQIPSASAILDTSNYTFQAISYGKDPEGFKYHAHALISPSGDGKIKVVSYGPMNVSSYSSKVTASALSQNYKQYPSSPIPTDTRLEMRSTATNYSASPDLGQYLNPTIHPDLSAYYQLIGGIPSKSGSPYIVYNSSGGMLFSGNILPSTYNLSGLMDSSGFLTFAPGNLIYQQTLYLLSLNSVLFPDSLGLGVIRSAESTFPSGISLRWSIPPGDLGALNLFGGIYQIGLWCLDIKEMLKQGNNPPYIWNPLNNVRKYKLFAKNVFSKDLINYSDALGQSGFVNLFQQLFGWENSIGMIINWNINFV
jgi:hypothetical protein